MPTFNWRQGLLGLLIGVACHGIAFLLGFFAGRLVRPSEGGGFEDVAAVALTFLLTEGIVSLAALVSGGVLIGRGKRDLGIGLLAGWLIGIVIVVLMIRGRA